MCELHMQHLKHSVLTSYIQAIVTGKLCKRGHIVGVVGKVVSLLCNTLCSLQDAVIVCCLKLAKMKTTLKWGKVNISLHICPLCN